MKLPNTLPMSPLRQLINWIARPYDFLDHCAKNYGDTFTVRLMGFPPLVMLSDPQAIGEIFATDAKQFDAGKNNEILKPLLGNNSLFLLDGDRHKRERKMLMPPFHGGSSGIPVVDTRYGRWSGQTKSFIAMNVENESLKKIVYIKNAIATAF